MEPMTVFPPRMPAMIPTNRASPALDSCEPHLAVRRRLGIAHGCAWRPRFVMITHARASMSIQKSSAFIRLTARARSRRARAR
jgi:hypothetical protein